MPNVRSILKRPGAAILPLCFAAASTGLGWMVVHESTPGDHRAHRAITPADLGVSPGNRGAVVVFAHPQCPCTRTTLRNLRDLGPWSSDLPLIILIAGPRGAAPDWFRTETWTLAQSIPGAQVRQVDERLVRLAGVRTSGHTLAFDPARRLILDGGVTFGRAHDGANTGLDTLRSLRGGSPVQPIQPPVFGCPILDEPDAACDSPAPPTSPPKADTP